MVGVALWPGGTLDDWKLSFNTSNAVNELGLSPCRNLTVNSTTVTGRDFLVRHSPPLPSTHPHLNQAARGVLFATYAVVVDTLTSVSLFWHDVERAWASIPEDGNRVLSAVVFRDAWRSEPVYLRSENTTLTQGNGTATLLSFVARFGVAKVDPSFSEANTQPPAQTRVTWRALTGWPGGARHAAGLTHAVVSQPHWAALPRKPALVCEGHVLTMHFVGGVM